MSNPEQKQADAEFLREALASGPCRYDQMTEEIYTIYRRWGFDPQEHQPEWVLGELDPRCFFCGQSQCNNKCIQEQIEGIR